MKNEMLYIDGQLVDLSDNVDITLNYKSNLFTDFGKIVGNNTYTIKLPKTMRNLNSIGISDIPSVVSSFPRSYHSARYFRNGIEIISDGRAVLMGVGDSIEIVLVWGSTSALFRIVEDGKKLDEFQGIDDWVWWSKNSSPYGYTGTDKVLFSDIDMGITEESDLAALHPCVRSTYIFDLLKSEYGLSVEFTEEKKDFINSLIIPLLTIKGGYIHELVSKLTMTYLDNNSVNMTSPYGWVVTGQGDEMDNYFTVNEFDFDAVTGNEVILNVIVKTDCHLIFTPNIKNDSPDFRILYGSDVLENELFLPYTVGEDGMYHFNTQVVLDLSAGDAFRLDTHFVEYGSTMVVTSKPDAIKVGDRFPIVENLPDIKVVDFLKALAAISGTFVVSDKDGDGITFVPFDALVDKSSSVDWSKKMLLYDSYNRPRNIGYSLDDFARNNRMRWKGDDTVNVITDGNIEVDDTTIEFERDAVELPFAASDMQGSRARIKLYEYNDDNEPELQDVEPRLLVEKNVGGYSTGSFEGLDWAVLLSKYYKTYQNAVKSPVVITERVLLDELSLRDLDVSKPVYLRQYGRYYAVVEVKAPSSGVCECKLLQLND